MELIGDVWHIRSHALAREVLRLNDATTQSGFNAEYLASQLKGLRLPILYGTGEDHRAYRTKVAQYFTPKAVQTTHRPVIEEASEEIVAAMLAEDVSDFTAQTYRLSVRIAAHVIGLGVHDVDGLAIRLGRLFAVPAVLPGQRVSRFQQVRTFLISNSRTVWFWWRDVHPAVRANRAQPGHNVISHLLDSGYREVEIVTECITYGAAGMITTREFLQVALWHLLENEQLRADFQAADTPKRHAILLEILRLEPVVGHLHRRADRDFTLSADGRTYQIAKGALLDLYLRVTNVDPEVFGTEPDRLCPARELPTATRPEGLSFGEGQHRCPGNFLAIAETEVLLSRLLVEDVTLVSPPSVQWEELVEGYKLTGFTIRVRPR